MKASEIAKWFDALLEIDMYESSDPSKNGLQVDNSGRDISRVAFAVDACLETIRRAAEAGAQMLFVHHGLLWKEIEPLRGAHYRRIKALFDADLALYASHLPLDAHGEIGNNAGIAAAIGLEELEPFGEYRGRLIGYRGRFHNPRSLDSILAALAREGCSDPHVLPCGPKDIRTAAIVSGGAAFDVHQAIEAGIDVYITGEAEHEIYHPVLENGIHFVAGGHYQTEVFGPKLAAARFARETGIDTVFIDVPTGL